jgi:hypothetical protein
MPVCQKLERGDTGCVCPSGVEREGGQLEGFCFPWPLEAQRSTVVRLIVFRQLTCGGQGRETGTPQGSCQSCLDKLCYLANVN